MPSNDLQLERLSISAPPILCDAIGYRGQARFVAFYWPPGGDELMFTDGNISADGDWYAWLVFVHHWTVAPQLAPYDFGSSDEEAKHWLLVDRQTNELYIGAPREVCKLLVQQPTQAVTSDLARDDVIPKAGWVNDLNAFLTEELVEVQPPSHEEIQREMVRRQRLTKELQSWLNNSLC
jgi:hypothetical protein